MAENPKQTKMLTAGHKQGLWASYYHLQSVGKNGLFTVFREDIVGERTQVKIAELK